MNLTVIQAGHLLARFLDGSVGPYEWDDFESVDHADRAAQALVYVVWTMARRFPPERATECCGNGATRFLQRLADAARSERLDGPTEAEWLELKAGGIPVRYRDLMGLKI